MVYNFRVHSEANKEFYKGMDWYEEHSLELRSQFYLDVTNTFQRIIVNPFSFPEYERNYRKALLSVFPYNVIFKIRDKTISVHSVLHHSRSNKKVLKRRFRIK